MGLNDIKYGLPSLYSEFWRMPVPAGRELFSGRVSVSVEEEQAVRSRPKRTMPKSASFFMIV